MNFSFQAPFRSWTLQLLSVFLTMPIILTEKLFISTYLYVTHWSWFRTPVVQMSKSPLLHVPIFEIKLKIRLHLLLFLIELQTKGMKWNTPLASLTQMPKPQTCNIYTLTLILQPKLSTRHLSIFKHFKKYLVYWSVRQWNTLLSDHGAVLLYNYRWLWFDSLHFCSYRLFSIVIYNCTI